MPQNVEVIQQAVDHLNETGVPAFHLLDAEITFITRPDLEGPTTYSGIDGFRDAMSMFAYVWDEIRWEIQDITGADDIFVIEFLFSLRGAASGIDVQANEAWAVWMNDGKFVRIEQYGTKPEALAAAGLGA